MADGTTVRRAAYWVAESRPRNDGRFRTFIVNNGEITFTFTAPAPANVTSVISALSADGGSNKTSIGLSSRLRSVFSRNQAC